MELINNALFFLAGGILAVGAMFFLIQGDPFGRAAKRRRIYRFFDGKRWRSIDPMVPFRTLAQHERFDWEKTPQELAAAQQIGDKTLFFQSASNTVDAIRQGFGLKPFDQGGLTEFECVDLLLRFQEWLNVLKKNTSTPQISMEPTGVQSDSITPNGLDSSSISTEPKDAEVSSSATP
jgi:hypothetical protein